MQFKKVLSSLLVVILLLSMAVFTVSADDTKTMDFAVETNSTADSEGKYIVKGGDEIEVSITIASNPGAAYFQLAVEYDAAALTPVVGADGKVAVEGDTGYSFENPLGTEGNTDGIKASEGKIELISTMWDAPNSTKTGKIVTVKFKVVDGFHGDADVVISKALAYNADNATVATTVKNASFISHKMDNGTVTAPTCTEAGYTTYKCTESGCDYSYKVEGDAATGHNYVKVPAVAPTETETGLTEGEACSVCGDVKVAQEVVPATGEATPDTDPVDEEDGGSLLWLWIVIAVVVVAGAGVAVFFVLKSKGVIGKKNDIA